MDRPGVVIVTGASRGLGREIAEVAFRAGYPVALVARSRANLREVGKALRKLDPQGPAVSVHAVDLTKEGAVRRELARIVAAHGSVRALVNNAATWMGTTSARDVTSAQMRESLELNFFSAFHITRALLDTIGERPRGELAIINIGATAALDAWAEVLPFCVAKGALRGLSRALARELGPKGIHVAHLVIDGVLDNDRTRKLNRSLEAERFVRSSSVAESVLQVIRQERSCWTMEWDVRPYNENW